MAHAIAVTRQWQKNPGWPIENMGTTQNMWRIHMRLTEIFPLRRCQGTRHADLWRHHSAEDQEFQWRCHNLSDG